MQAVVEEWPDSIDAKAPPLFVFVTAHQQFAIDAFELAAIDYIVKPVSARRLQKTVERLKSQWATRGNTEALDLLVDQAAGLLAEPPSVKKEWIESVRAGIGDTVHLIPVSEIIMFEASDKYVVVHTDAHQALIREPLRALLPTLNPVIFKQVHRSTIVNMNFVESASRIGGNKMQLTLKGCEQKPSVSRLYRHLFKAM
ncbi:UNVERIFIED_CONTAM: hypothetical protein GTU68_039967 [Idotea baltica]|nr:hypothetical protein [Idotea baltica]